MRFLPICLLALAAPALADTTFTIAHSGYLLNGSDLPVDGSVPMVFRVYDAPTGAGSQAPWVGGCTVSVSHGYYAVTLGSGCGEALSLASWAGAPRYLEVTVAGAALLPRALLASAPASLLAADAQALGGVAAAGYPRLQTGTTSAQPGALHVSGAVKAASFEGSGALVTNVDAATIGGVTPGVLARLQAGATSAQTGALHVSGAVKAGSFEGAGALVTGVDAAKVGGLTLTELDARYAAASAGSGFGAGGACNVSSTGGMRWYGGQPQVCNGTSWVSIVTVPAPAITTIDPVRGRQAGGGTITVMGTNFRTPLRLLIGGVEATSVSVTGTTKITAQIPASATTGVKDVVVENDDASSDKRTAAFTYVAQLYGDAVGYPGSSCKQIYDDGVRDSGLRYVDLDGGGSSPSRQYFCEMQLDGGGWTLFEKTQSGSAAVTATTAELNFSNLQNDTSSGVNGKVSDADIRALLGNGAGEILWRNLSESSTDYLKLKFPAALITAWSASKRYNATPRDFWFYRYAESKWYGANGHINNVHISGYNDGGSGLSPAWSVNNLETSSGRSVYWHFHTSSSNVASGHFFFYGR